MKLELSNDQTELLDRIKIPYDSSRNYDGAAIMLLLDKIICYVLAYEIAQDEVTPFGEELLTLHNFIVDKYDS